MGDAIIFVVGISLGSVVTMMILLVAIATDYMRENDK